MLSGPTVSPSLRVILTLVMAYAAARLCVALHTPLPWMIGPLLITAALSILGMPTRSWTPLRNSAQWAIGAALGLDIPATPSPERVPHVPTSCCSI